MPWNAVSGQGTHWSRKWRKRKFENKGLLPRLDVPLRMLSLGEDAQYPQGEEWCNSPLWYSELTDEANDDEASGAVAQGSTLGPNPRSLYMLWDEYENDIGGRKAARLFSREERGKVKDKFHWRKVVWDCVATLVRAGLTAQVSIDHIHHIYGENTTVTNIINRMRHDRWAGVVNPMLQV